jgi:hypothetical protein
VKLMEGILFVKLDEAGGGWLWRNGRIDNKPDVVPSCLNEFTTEKVKGRMRNIGG